MYGACMAWPAGEVHRDSNATVISTTSSAMKQAQIPQSKNQLVCCGKMGSVQMVPPFSLGHVVNTAGEAGAAANHAATNKNTKYSQLSNTHVFVPVAIETGGTWHPQAVELVQEIGIRMANITGDARESNFLFQQLSVAGGMRSHLKTRSPPASSLQSVVSFS